MNSRRKNPRLFAVRPIVVITVLVMVAGCASTRLIASWYDADYAESAALDDVLIIGLFAEETARRLYEDAFVEQLARREVRAIQSYTLQSADIEPTKPAVANAVAEAGARAVLITRHLDTDTRQHYRPPERVRVYADPYYGRMHSYYPLAYREVYTPGYSYTVTTVTLESNLYDTATEKLLWSAQSASIDPQMTRSFIDELVTVFAADLEQKRLL